MRLKLIKGTFVVLFSLLTFSIYGQENEEFLQKIECLKKVIEVGFNNRGWNLDSINQLELCNDFMENKELSINNDTLFLKVENDTTSWQKVVLQSDTAAIIILKLPRLIEELKCSKKKKDSFSRENESCLIYLRYTREGKYNFYKNAL